MAITAVAEPTATPPRVRIDTTSPETWRVDSDGVAVQVRGEPVAGVLYDYEPRYVEPYQYSNAPRIAVAPGVEYTGLVQLSPAGSPLWLIPVSTPTAARVLRVARDGFLGWVRAVPQVVVDIPGRAEAVAVTGRRGARSSDLEVVCLTHTERTDLQALLASGDTLMLGYSVSAWRVLAGVRYVAVGETSESIRGYLLGGAPTYTVTLPLTEVARPSTLTGVYRAIGDLTGAIGDLRGIIGDL